MNRLLTLTLLVVSTSAFTITAKADDRWETLRAINWVENPTNHTRIGRFGELGPYQFRPATWRMHTRKPFSLAVQREAADEVAVIHYEWIKANLEKAGVDATPFNIAMAWNCGVSNVVSGHAPEVSYNYAERVVNLVHSFKRRTPAPVPAKAEAPTVAEAAPVVIPSLDNRSVSFSMMPDAPKFDVVVPPAAPDPVVYTSHDPEAAKPRFVVAATTTATLTPRFSLVPKLLD